VSKLVPREHIGISFPGSLAHHDDSLKDSIHLESTRASQQWSSTDNLRGSYKHLPGIYEEHNGSPLASLVCLPVTRTGAEVPGFSESTRALKLWPGPTAPRLIQLLGIYTEQLHNMAKWR